MSASNWAVCPFCLSIETARVNAEWIAAKESYGKVSLEEFIENRDEAERNAKALETEGIGNELREDYELGIDNEGKFYLRYAAKCVQCNYSFEYSVDADTHMKGKNRV